jgi:hypothetical protein
MCAPVQLPSPAQGYTQHERHIGGDVVNVNEHALQQQMTSPDML